MSLTEMIRIRDAVTALCRAIDAGEVTPTEPEMLALAIVVERQGGPLAHDLLCQLASRCRNGRKVLDRMDRALRGGRAQRETPTRQSTTADVRGGQRRRD